MGNEVSHYLILPNRILSYAKIIYFTLTSVQTFLFLLCAMRGGTHVRRNPLIAHNAEMNIYAPFQVIVFYRMKNPKQKRVRLSYTVLYLGMEP